MSKKHFLCLTAWHGLKEDSEWDWKKNSMVEEFAWRSGDNQ